MLDKLLLKVQKPARYTGDELNSCMKDTKLVNIRYALCFPDIYEVGMSHLGLRILYHLLNQRNDTFCERAFAPWLDMEQLMKQENISLFALESKDPLKDFDFLGFTLQYEMSYTNILNMLALSDIPILAKERCNTSFPLIHAGGPCAVNPEPLAEVMDFFVIGEGEEVTPLVLDAFRKWDKLSKSEFLNQIAKIPGIYVPSLYETCYSENKLTKIIPINNQLPFPIKRQVVEDLDNVSFPDKLIVPFIETIHDRISLEIFRGCTRGCRFCQAGIIYRPQREKSPKTLLKQAKSLLDSTGYEEISLCSLSTSDYSHIEEFLPSLVELTEKEKVNLSLPSLRVDSFSLSILEQSSKVRKGGLTFAPEAGTQRLRDIINKNITEDDILGAAKIAFERGYSTIKLYFMIGLPYETDEDILGIAELAKKVLNVYYKTEKRAPSVNINISVSSFVPKAHTPFQWAEQNSADELLRKQNLLRGAIKSKQIRCNCHHSQLSHLEGVFSRGDRRLGKVLIKAHQLGCRFDAWSEVFDFSAWSRAFSETGVNPLDYTGKREANELLPWSIIDPLVSTEFLQEENKRAEQQITTPPCKSKCSLCGINKELGAELCSNI